MLELNKIYLGDCLDLMPQIQDQSIDAVICDLPYGTTSCKWDVIIPFDKLWGQYKRICKPNAAIVLFGRQPFTSAVVMSNIKMFRYELIWQKEKGTDFGNANRKPLNAHENIIVFYRSMPTYNKQMLKGEPYVRKNNRTNHGDDLNFKSDNSGTWVNNGERTPLSVMKFARDTDSFHPTQKPVDLIAYLVRTYTNPNDVILDNCMGSGSTIVAAIKEKRQYNGIEKDEHFFEMAKERIAAETSQLSFF